MFFLHRSNMHKNFKCCFNMIHIRRILTSMEFRPIFSSLYRSSLLAWSRNNITFHYRVTSIWCKYDVFISLTTATEMPKIHNFHWRNTILTNSQFRRSFDTFGIVKYYTVKHEGKKTPTNIGWYRLYCVAVNIITRYFEHKFDLY